MKTLIDDLLEYSRSERRALQRARVDLAALVDDVVKGLAEAIASAGAVMIVALPPASLLADPEGVAQVVRNLVENALKFSRGQAPPRVEIGARVDGASCTLSVRDNGVGFDMQYHERIFEIFQRLHRAEDYPGTGIGLALVHKAVSRMGGRVWAESAPGHGATFFVELPLAAAVPSAPGGAA
jgi:signal transduction histidine kinase